MGRDTTEGRAEDTGESERALVERITEALPPPARTALEYFSLPHWVDDRVLERLKAKDEGIPTLGAVNDYGLLEQWTDGARAVRGVVRRYVLERMAAERPEEFRRRSAVLAAVFSDVAEHGGDVFHHIESVYHGLVADPDRGTAQLLADGIAWKSEPFNAFEPLAALVMVAREQQERGLLSSRAGDVLALLRLYVPGGVKSAREEEEILDGLNARIPPGGLFAAELYLRLGMNRIVRGRTEEARKLLDSALTRFRELGIRRGEGDALRALGRAALRADDLGAARHYFTEAQVIFSKLGLKMSAAQCVKSLGETALYLGHYSAAERMFEEALASFTATDGHLGEANTRVVYSQLLAACARFPAAHQHISLAKETYVAINNGLGIGNCLKNSGVALFEAEQYGEARKTLAEAEIAYSQWGSASGLANCNLWTAACLTRERRPDAALPLLDSAVILFSDIGDRYGKASAWREQGIALTQSGDFPEAIVRLDQAEREFSDVGNKVEALAAAVAHGMAVIRAGSARTDTRRELASIADRARQTFAAIGHRRHLREAEELREAVALKAS
jgi:tetratricopeptide (TPR) repeat protein